MAKFTPTNFDKLIGQRIQKKRKEQGYSAEKLSEYVDISQPQLSRYERGTNKINITHLIAIATFLKTPISYFFADCILEQDWNNDELDKHWFELTTPQKQRLIDFINAIRQTKNTYN